MCDDSRLPSRRTFLHGAAVLAAAASVPTGRRPPRRLPLRSPARPVAADGTNAYSMAMHIHSSFSEQQGSMDAQLFQAAANSLDVMWWTDHDHRMDALDYRDVTHFTSFAEVPAAGQGGKWSWQKVTSGPLVTTASSGGIVSTPCSPNDPVSGGALHVQARSSSTAPAKLGYYANCQPGGFSYRDNLTGQTIQIDVMLAAGWSRGYLEYLITTSTHPATSGRPTGTYSLSYRFTPGGAASSSATGNAAVIVVPITTATAWQTVTLSPSTDIQALWPDVDYRDFALWQIDLSAVSTGDKVAGYFDYMLFDRSISGQAFMTQQADMMNVLGPKYPTLTQLQGTEISAWNPHVNWFGQGVVLPGYTGQNSTTYTGFLQNSVVPAIHNSGGLASYNHPFGTQDGPLLPASGMDSKLASVASALLASNVLGCDLLEVGYHLRGQCDLAHHLALWDVMSRNAVFLTGNGTSDDHAGVNWLSSQNNWFTACWAASTGLPDLLSALASGRAWCASLSAYRGALDLLVDGVVPMGKVSVSPVPSRLLAATATNLPAGSSLQVLQGAVDYAGQNALSANTVIVGSYPAASMAGGQVTQAVDTTGDSFVRTQVVSSGGAVIATSNPVWLLRTAPPGGIPAARAA